MAWLFMLPSPARGPFIGSNVCGKPLDAYSEVLMCATLPFDSWRVRHDKIKSEIRSIGYEAGVNVDPEPYGLFSQHIPAAALANTGPLHHQRERQGLVPDLLISYINTGDNREFLGEIKLISAGISWYQSGRKAVDIRAQRLPKEYRDKAYAIDNGDNGVSDDQVGPVEGKLNTFGELQGLVVGQFAESSQRLHDLLIRFADEKVLSMSRSRGVVMNDQTRSQIFQQVRRRFSVGAIKAQSACLLSRLGHFSECARQASQWRAEFRRREEALT